MSKLGGRHLAAALFGILGVVTISLGVAEFALGRTDLEPEVALSLVYAAAACLTGYGLWRRSRIAPWAFLMWCTSIVLYMAAVLHEEPGLRNPGLIPAGILLLAIFYVGWRNIHRICAPAA